jgi:hypothetical protein
MFLWFNEITPKFQEKWELCDDGLRDMLARIFLFLSTVNQNNVFKMLLLSEIKA